MAVKYSALRYYLVLIQNIEVGYFCWNYLMLFEAHA